MNWKLRQLGSRGVSQLDIDLIANVGDRSAEVILDLSDEIEERVFSAALLGQRQFAARNLNHQRNEILGPVELEIIQLQGDREFGNGVSQHERVFELSLLFHRA